MSLFCWLLFLIPFLTSEFPTFAAVGGSCVANLNQNAGSDTAEQDDNLDSLLRVSCLQLEHSFFLANCASFWHAPMHWGTSQNNDSDRTCEQHFSGYLVDARTGICIYPSLLVCFGLCQNLWLSLSDTTIKQQQHGQKTEKNTCGF